MARREYCPACAAIAWPSQGRIYCSSLACHWVWDPTAVDHDADAVAFEVEVRARWATADKQRR